MSELLDEELVSVERQHHDDNALFYIVKMKGGENRFTLAMNEQLHKCLDKIESDLPQHPPTSRVALIVSGAGKYFSLGLDLESYYTDATFPQKLFHNTYQRLLARLLSFPMVTIAAINGHAIAGGMVFALACDYRVMNSKRGFMAMNEIKLPSSIPAGMMEVVKAKIKEPSLQRDCLLLGRQYPSVEMHRFGIIDQLADDEGSVMLASVALAKKHSHPLRKSPFIGLIKQNLYRGPLKHLVEEESVDHFKFAFQVNKL